MSCGTPCCVGSVRSLRTVRGSSCCLCSASPCLLVHPSHCQCPRKGLSRLSHRRNLWAAIRFLNRSRTTHDPFAGAWEEPWPPKRIQGDHSEPHPMEPHLPKEAVAEASQPSAADSTYSRTSPPCDEQHHRGARGRSSYPDHS